MEILSDAKFRGTINIVSPDRTSDHGFVFSGSECTLYLKGNGNPNDIYFQFGDGEATSTIFRANVEYPSSGTEVKYIGSIKTASIEGKDLEFGSNYLLVNADSVKFKDNGCVYFMNGLSTNYLYTTYCGNEYGAIHLPYGKTGTIATLDDIPSLSGYLTTSAASSTYLSKTDASSTYLSKTTASSTYLSKTDASSTYQKKFTTFSSPSIPANCTAFEFTGTAISDSNKTHLIQVQNTSTGKSVIAETWMTTNKKPAMSFAGCTSTVAAGTYTAIVL